MAEGSSIRSIECITGVDRDTIMRLGVRASDMAELDCSIANARFTVLLFAVR